MTSLPQISRQQPCLRRSEQLLQASVAIGLIAAVFSFWSLIALAVWRGFF